jgi:AcrR family transcriptional regulator
MSTLFATRADDEAIPVVVKIIIKKPKPKRKAGTRAGLTKTLIATEAAKLIESGIQNFSLRKLATILGVVPTSIRAHFNGDVLGELLDEVVRTALGHVARPFKPKEEAADYLRDLFLAILQSLHGKPHVSTLAAGRIMANPDLLPLLAERLLTRACPHLSQASAHTSCNPAEKLRAVFS